MNLIDVLVEELPNRGGWMEGVEHAWCDPDGEIRFRNGGCKPDFYPETDVDIEFRVPDSPYEDDSHYIITREQYEAALAAKNDGWIDWGGGKHPPVSTNTVVDVKFKNGYVQSGYPAGEYSWVHAWQSSNIIAYRPHKPKETEQAKEDDEAELNECIGQDAAPVWNGEGLPPAGCECEYTKENLPGNEWTQCIVDYVGSSFVVYRDCYGVELTGIIGDIKFRPIRSEADKKSDDAKHAIAELCRSSASNGHSADLIYDAIAAGKIPGVKLED